MKEMDFDSGYGLERLKTYAEFKYEIYKLQEEKAQLENNWKELKKWLEEEFEYDKNWYNPKKEEYIGPKHFPDDTIDGFRYVLNKMQEIESGKNE